ncbi:F0F1 ATP synthase subunit alpha [Candidatus Gracilibacteria bacterium]|nr:F0F1 ATP synthase subunit alpha [Candidatus Gracilibacteria bacterium]MCF7898439.1 F0F1 ATP synthase subunit alpha [Candidatus Paceibacterota bacterium]
MSVEKIIKDLEQKIAEVSTTLEVNEIGTVISVSDGIARVSGLLSVASMEEVTFSSGAKGIALNLESDIVGVVIVSNADKVREGEEVSRSGRVLSIPVGEALLGRVVDPLMNPVDGEKLSGLTSVELVEKIAPGVMEREPVNVPMQTGVKSIDAMIPIGRGQRELIIGDRQTGKTTIAIDTIINQKDSGVICVYVAIGQKESKIAQIVKKLRDSGAMEYTVVVLAGASHSAALSYLAPYAGTAVAEYFMNKQKDVLVVYDDLSKHAVAYREMSLLLKRPPGREAYPGDVFYLHSRLLERSCRRNKGAGGGSITALPIIETQAGDVSAYIPTNVISITDGQIFLDSNLFYKGMRPAIDVGLSVSRVGSSAQTKAMKKNAGKMKLAMAQYRELESFAQFDSDLDIDTKRTIERGKRTQEMLKQANGSPLRTGLQVGSVYAVNNGFLDNVQVADVVDWEKAMHIHMSTFEKELLINVEKDWSEEIENSLKEALTRFCNNYGKEE